MEEHQKQALEQAYALLGEHFDGMVIIIRADLGDMSGSKVIYKGSYMEAVGLVTWAQSDLLLGDKGAE